MRKVRGTTNSDSGALGHPELLLPVLSKSPLRDPLSVVPEWYRAGHLDEAHTLSPHPRPTISEPLEWIQAAVF